MTLAIPHNDQGERAAQVVPAPASRELGGIATIAASLVYLTFFVPKGWMPHDEGMIGQAAERVLRGDLPHVHYHEPYTGGLTWLNAAVFTVAGIDLVHIRWLLFAAAAVGTWTVYRIARRRLSPVWAAVCTWVSLAWTFPNYFASLPSWWVLVCALLCLLAFIRYVETDRLRYLAAAGAAVGISIAIKQTGVYLLAALLLAVWYPGTPPEHPRAGTDRTEWFARLAIGATALAAVCLLLSPRLGTAEAAYLVLPVAACLVAFILPFRFTPDMWRSRIAATAIVVVTAAVPAVLLVLPYVPGHVGEFLTGAFVMPTRRVTVAAWPMPSAVLILTGVSMAALMLPMPRTFTPAEQRIVTTVRWAIALALPLLALVNVWAYQFVWHSARAIAALLPAAVCALLWRREIAAREDQRIVFAAACIFAWASLVQFPYSSAIYFCYVAPLALVGAILASGTAPRLRGLDGRPLAALMIAFAVLSMNRGTIDTLGQIHSPVPMDTPLDLPRAHLVLPDGDVEAVRRMVSLVNEHLGDGGLVAGPDCPEVYFLTARVNPSGALFDALTDSGVDVSGSGRSWIEPGTSVLVLNHRTEFSAPPAKSFLDVVRREFPHGEMAGWYEVRWR